jgi:hypothetical protein
MSFRKPNMWAATVRVGRCLALFGTIASVRSTRAASPAGVQRAIDRGRDFLFAVEKDGNWEDVQARVSGDVDGASVRNTQWGGMTAVATLSLLAAGVDATDPHLKSAIAFLRAADIHGVYALGMRAQVWGLLPPEPWVRQSELVDRKLLEQGLRLAAGPARGFYGYAATPASDYDHSVSQFGVLGMWALEQAGVEVPTAYWDLVDAAWRRDQSADGSWSYNTRFNPGDNLLTGPGPSMTAAGVATLSITREYTRTGARCLGNVDDPNINAGLRYLGASLPSVGEARRWYILFGVSRVGLASGYKYLGATDWFRFGSDLAVNAQSPDGSWHDAREVDNVNGVADTAFALLFLSRGRAPVMMSKLQYDVVRTDARDKPPVLAWNQRPRDVANLTRWVGKQIESPLNWQVVDLHQTRTDLHDAPLLYMSGSKLPGLSPGDVDSLRAYCEDGGLLVGHADCSSPEFAKGFGRLGQQMFPGRAFRPLEPTSPIFTNETFAASRSREARVAIDALGNGARELMVLLPAGDPARTWQTQSFRSAKNEPYGQLMINLFLYAVDKQGLRRRGETYLVDRDARVPSAPVAATVARVRYAGNWDPEPGGWRRLANVMHNQGLAELTVTPVAPSTGGKLDPATTTLASLTFAAVDGAMTATERSAIRDYVGAGGTLLVDVAGGRSEYRTAAEAELAKLFPDARGPLPVLPPDSPVYVAAGPAMSAKLVAYRQYERPSRSLHDPLLRGLAVGGRVAVFYSPQDVSVGLVGQPIDGVAGYVPDDATKVVADVVAYAVKRSLHH